VPAVKLNEYFHNVQAQPQPLVAILECRRSSNVAQKDPLVLMDWYTRSGVSDLDPDALTFVQHPQLDIGVRSPILTGIYQQVHEHLLDAPGVAANPDVVDTFDGNPLPFAVKRWLHDQQCHVKRLA